MEFKETLPKSGHVHEVCKEWLVREDGALAYRLQSQEINEYYQGNKFRNAVVRQDFPTALLEQIKEHETAEQEAARYYKLLKEQEEADKCLAEKIANKLEKDEQINSKQIEENELVAKELQETYVNLNANNPHYVPTSSSHSFCSSKDITPEDEQKEQFVSADFSENVICDRFEKLHCRPRNDVIEQDYEQCFDVANNIRNADIFQPQADYYQRQDSNSMRKHQEGAIERTNFIVDNDNGSWPQEHIISRKHTKSIGVVNKANRNYTTATELPVQLNIPSKFDDINELDLSTKDFEELNKKLLQEKSDEELARYLQKEEQKCNMSQEEKDRLLAIEAQDKELAIMLQEREKSKAKRAKEKARLKKLQAKESLAENPKLPVLNEPYSDPRDLITESQPDFKFTSKATNHHIPSMNQHVEVNRNHYNTHGEDIYALPIDNTNNDIDLRSSEEMNASISSARSVLSSPSSLTASYRQTGTESCPKPPYMPIHDIGNNLPLEGKKKKSKDKCTHQ